MQNLQGKQNKKRKGFTLVELIIVVVIIGILVGLGAMLYGSATGDANTNVVKSNLKTMESAIRLYQVEHSGTVPANSSSPMVSTDAIAALVSSDTYSKPAGAQYVYVAPTSGTPGSITCTFDGKTETLALPGL